MKPIFTVFSLMLAVLASLSAQQGGTLVRPLDFVSQIQDVYVDDTGRGWAGGTCGVLLTTTDSGENWQRVTPPLDADLTSVACAPSGCQTNIILVYSDDQYARSTDNGENWTLFDFPESNAFPRRIDFFSDEVALAYSNNDEILRTTDGGDSWSIDAFPGYMRTNMEFPAENTACFVDQFNKFYRTTDQGATWDTTAYTHPISSRKIGFWSADSGYLFDQDRNLYRTTDAGQTFSLVNDQGTLPSNLTFLAALSEDRVVGVQVTDRVYESNDGGETWSSYELDLGDGTFVKPDYHRRGDEFWLASNLSSIFYSSSNFSDWTNQIPGERVEPDDIVFTDAQTGYLVDRNSALFKSTDAGSTWSLHNNIEGFNNRLTVLQDGSLMLLNTTNHPQVSVDGGNTFTDYLPASVTDQYPDAKFYRYAIRPDGAEYFVSYSHAIFSTDWTSGFTEVSLDSVVARPQNQLYFFDDLLGFMIDNGAGRYARTTDGGLTWESYSGDLTNQPLSRVYFRDADNGMMFTTSRVFRTSDGGDNWELDFMTPGASDYEIAPNGQLLSAKFAGGNDGVANFSNDNGESWTEFAYNCSPFRGTAMTPDGRYFFAYGDGGVVIRYDMDIVNPTAEVASFTEQLRAYPNPAKSQIFLDLESFPSANRMLLSDLQGRQVAQAMVTFGQQRGSLELSHLPSGVYVLQLLGTEGLLGTQRVIID